MAAARVHAFNPSTWEAEAGGSLCVQGQPDLQNEFQNSQDHTVKPCLKKAKEAYTYKKCSIHEKSRGTGMGGIICELYVNCAWHLAAVVSHILHCGLKLALCTWSQAPLTYRAGVDGFVWFSFAVFFNNTTMHFYLESKNFSF